MGKSLSKSRFVEMFGDPVLNPYKLKKDSFKFINFIMLIILNYLYKFPTGKPPPEFLSFA